MKNRLSDAARLHHILDAIAEIESYLIAVDMDVFINNSMMRFACIKQLEIIGEASNMITVETKLKFEDVEWRKIVGMRHVFVHEYFGIDTRIVWEIIKTDLPPLKEKIENILKQL
jgi:uncharacterized protein with HEPN domain